MTAAIQQDTWQPPTLIGQAVRVAVVFGVMVAIAVGYQMTFVPWIEPTITPDDTDVVPTVGFLGQQKQRLALYFSPRSWQLGSTKVLESNNIMLLMKDFREVGENRLELEPLTIIAFETDVEQEKWDKPVVILNAEKAILQFSELNLAFGKIGDLVGGQLLGNVQITRKSADGNHEPLNVLTSDVMLASNRIETKKDVQFQMGKHQGSGRHLIAQFEEGPNRGQQKGPNISGLSVLELVHVDRIVLSTEGRGLLGNAAEMPGMREQSSQMYASAPVEIRCLGPFVFDGSHRVATFRDQVQVRRLVASGVTDQLEADLLEVHFQKEDPAESAEPKTDSDEDSSDKPSAKLKMQRLVAVGSPFRLSATSVSANAEGGQLIYDLIKKRIEVKGSPTAILTKDKYRCESPHLMYELGDNPSHLGRVWSAGPGVFTGNLNDKDPSELSRLSWQEQFRIEPQNGEYAVAVEGNATVSGDKKGQISGDKLFVFLQDVTPPGEKKQKLIPSRLHGIGRISIDTPQLVGRANEIKTWFQFDEPQLVPGNEPGKLPTGPAPGAPPGNAPAQPPLAQQQNSEEKPTRFRLSGETIQLVVRFDGQKSHLDSAQISGQVQMAEMPEGEGLIDPFMVRGNVVQLLNAADNNAEIHVTGEPAVVSGRGLIMRSGRLRVNQLQGRIWTDGPGTLEFPLDRDFQGRKLAVPEYFNVQWQGGLQAQHDQITFDRAVKIQGRQSHLNTARLTITLNRPISFTDTNANKALSAKRVECTGGVQLYNRNVELGVLKSVDQFEGKTLAINQETGDIQAQGPGTAKTVMMGSPTTNIPGQPTSPKPPGEKQLTFLRVDFVSHVSGNVHRKEVNFHKVDRAYYGPVKSWDDEIDLQNPSAMNASDVTLRCDQLTVVQHDKQSGLSGSEILAMGNSEVQGKMFSAWADRISYSTEKHLLTMTGNGRNAAQLIHQQRIGGSRQTLTAGKIQYWPETRKFQVDDGKSIDVSGVRPNDVNIPKIPGLR
ncbi:LptA/OstA family protein [Bremerella sp. P1]|uniref:LptA/OstA family protein n=1 Tax=Bremerella sp. P1 TaxID=3026424 RepID=UPI002367808A|nr:LptA/OstA family protein [Bremerella sp. P1]WDI44687.1 LptA/OstA family protein [Bremerella sp. P1]